MRRKKKKHIDTNCIQKRQIRGKQSAARQKTRKIKESSKKMKKKKTATCFLSFGTQQPYEKGKEEIKKKENIRLWNCYYWQLKIFSPKSGKCCFTCVSTAMALNENKRERNWYNKSMEEVIHIE